MSMRVADVKCVRAAERAYIKDLNGELELVTRAATALADLAEKKANGGIILFVCGGGNNGADGYMAARLLLDRGASVKIYSLCPPKTEACTACLNALMKMRRGGIFTDQICECAVIIDCVFGIGLDRAPEGEYADMIDEINASQAVKISADVPSGLGTLGAYAHCVKADHTLTFIAVKPHLIMGTARNYTGEILLDTLGIECECTGYVTGEDDARLPRRETVSHKGTYGKVRVVGGCDVMPGAPLMCFEAAVAASRSGAGLVTLCVPRSEKAAYQARVKETMLKFMPARDGALAFDKAAYDELLSGADVIAVGCGMGKDNDAARIVDYLAHNFRGTLVLDADALNAVAAYPEIIKNPTAKLILTPHVVEFERLCAEKNARESAEEYVARIKRYAADNGVVLAVKSATTVVTDGNEVYFNITGTPAQAKGGSGDVLCGIVAAFACILDPTKATVAATYRFGNAAIEAQKRLNSEVSVLASDIIIEL